VEVSTIELRDALSTVTNEIIRTVRATIETTPPEIVADLMMHGIAMSGGGALLRGLDRRLAIETRFPVFVTEDPLRTVVKGCAESLEEAETLERVQSAIATRQRPR
jgi:rod shape-determining protein MreB